MLHVTKSVKISSTFIKKLFLRVHVAISVVVFGVIKSTLLHLV